MYCIRTINQCNFRGQKVTLPEKQYAADPDPVFLGHTDPDH